MSFLDQGFRPPITRRGSQVGEEPGQVSPFDDQIAASASPGPSGANSIGGKCVSNSGNGSFFNGGTRSQARMTLGLGLLNMFQQIDVRLRDQIFFGDFQALHHSRSNLFSVSTRLPGLQDYFQFDKSAQSFDFVQVDSRLPYPIQGAPFCNRAPNTQDRSEDSPEGFRSSRLQDVIHGSPRPGQIAPFVGDQFAMIFGKKPQFEPALRDMKENVLLKQNFSG